VFTANGAIFSLGREADLFLGWELHWLTPIILFDKSELTLKLIEYFPGPLFKVQWRSHILN
jgi:hypothetical protein